MPEEQKIKEIIEQQVRPALQSHGGDVEVMSIKDNVVTIKYQGACGGCPSAAMGTLQFIEAILKEKCHPEITVQMA